MARSPVGGPPPAGRMARDFFWGVFLTPFLTPKSTKNGQKPGFLRFFDPSITVFGRKVLKKGIFWGFSHIPRKVRFRRTTFLPRTGKRSVFFPIDAPLLRVRNIRAFGTQYRGGGISDPGIPDPPSGAVFGVDQGIGGHICFRGSKMTLFGGSENRAKNGLFY